MTLNTFPIFELIAFVYFFSFMASFISISSLKGWRETKVYPLRIWLVILVAVPCNDFLFIGALRFAPAIQVELVSCIWPALVVIISGLLPQHKFRFRSVFSSIAVFIGIYYMLTNGNGFEGLSKEYLKGYTFAFFAACSWCVYSLISRGYGKFSPEVLCVSFCLGFILFLTLHIVYESFMMPTFKDIFYIAVLGLTCHSLAYFLWDFAIKCGRFYLLHVCYYLTPILSSVLLVYFNFGKMNSYTWLAAALLLLSGLFTLFEEQIKWPKIKHFFFKF